MAKQSAELKVRPAIEEGGDCLHCGEPCLDKSLTQAGRQFCCAGCETVFSLLHESGLGNYYLLQVAPGSRYKAVSKQKWAFLDDPAVGERLFDFANATQIRVTLHLPVIHCVACVWLLENLFRLHRGVGRSQVNFARREASISFNPTLIKFSELASLLTSIGYEPQFTFAENQPAWAATWRRKTWLQIGVAGFAFGNIMLMSLPFYLGLDAGNGPWFRAVAGWLSLGLALPVVVYSASDFWRAAWVGFRQRRLTLEVPIALGLAAIYGTSFHEVITHQGPGYCDSLCGLIFFLLCGRMFQKKTYDRLAFDRDYRGFFPLSVMRKAASGEENVAISRLQTGDQLLLRNGELLPADARLISDEACLDYSFVTGESVPVKCQAGDHLYAGGRQVGGLITVETIKPVAQSYLATLWNNEAFRKPRDHELESLTNRYSRRFTRLVVGVALAAGTFWLVKDPARAERAFTAVLIVACPCALALAAPLTQGTAQRLLARLNIFLKNGLVIERLAEVDTVVLDKTGTLTTTDVQGVKFHPATGDDVLTPDELQWIGSLTRHSTHPHSLRITQFLAVEPLAVEDFNETPGSGIGGEVSGQHILAGSPAWLEAHGVAGRSVWPTSGMQVAINGQWRGSFALENSLRPEVAELIARLSSRFELALLSGDNAREAACFQKLFGDRAVLRFNQRPVDKLEFIRELQQRGHRVMMVGDGLNDAGALMQADVGVAVVEQIGVFSPASDVILDAAQLPRLGKLLEFSEQAVRVVRAGFLISALYNLAGISIAAAGLLAPIVCAILMPVSSATVVLFVCSATAFLGSKALKAPASAVQSTPDVPLASPATTSWEAA